MRQRQEAWLDDTARLSSMDRDTGSWKLLWKTQVLAKICMFLWRLEKHSLPTEDVKMNRNMSTTTTCGLCGADDSWRHSLLECSVSRCIWALVDGELAEHLIATSEPSAKQWLFMMIDTLSNVIVAFVRLAVMLWATWSARRKAIHEGTFQSPLTTHMFINRFISELDEVDTKQLAHVSTGPRREVPA